MYLSICVSVYLCICVPLHLCIYVSMYLCIYVSMCLCIYVSMYLCIYVSMYECMYLCMFICMYVHMYSCMYVCVWKYVCMLYVWFIDKGYLLLTGSPQSDILGYSLTIWITRPGGYRGWCTDRLTVESQGWILRPTEASVPRRVFTKSLTNLLCISLRYMFCNFYLAKNHILLITQQSLKLEKN